MLSWTLGVRVCLDNRLCMPLTKRATSLQKLTPHFITQPQLSILIGEGWDSGHWNIPEYHPPTITFSFGRAESYIADKSKILQRVPRKCRSSWIEGKRQEAEQNLRRPSPCLALHYPDSCEIAPHGMFLNDVSWVTKSQKRASLVGDLHHTHSNPPNRASIDDPTLNCAIPFFAPQT